METKYKIAMSLVISIVAIFLIIVLINIKENKDNPPTITSKNISLTSDEVESLTNALNSESKSRATYWKVNDNLGESYPFEDIEKEKAQNIEELRQAFQRYELTVPIDDWYGKVNKYSSTQSACRASVFLEQDNIQLYDTLATKTNKLDLLVLFDMLKTKAQEHLLKFKSCE